jgi:YHS domain-containing protein
MCYDEILNPVADSFKGNEFIFCSCECYEGFVELARSGEE